MQAPFRYNSSLSNEDFKKLPSEQELEIAKLKCIIRQLWGYIEHGWALQLCEDQEIVEDIFNRKEE